MKKRIDIPDYSSCDLAGAKVTAQKYFKQITKFLEWFEEFIKNRMFWEGEIRFQQFHYSSPNSSGVGQSFTIRNSNGKKTNFKLLIRNRTLSLLIQDRLDMEDPYVIKNCESKKKFEAKIRKYVNSEEYLSLFE